MPDSPVLRFDTDGPVAIITMDRPQAMNALNAELREAIVDAVSRLVDDDDLAVGVLVGEGGRAFSAGMDLKEVGGGLDDASRQASPRIRNGSVLAASDRSGPSAFTALYAALDGCSKPLIAAIDGHCLAGGFEVALLCDIRIATRSSTFGMPEPRRGLLGGPGLVLLSRTIPLGEALRYQLSGAAMSAERAWGIGLVQELAESREDLLTRVDAIAGEIAACSPTAVQYIKQVVKVGRGLPPEYAAAYAEMFRDAAWRSDDVREGVAAFTEKRSPVWTRR